MNKIYNGKHKWFDGDCLTYRKGGQKNSIDWQNCVGCTVEFQCRDYHGFYTILNRHPNPENQNKNNQKDFLYEIYFNDDKDNTFFLDQRILRAVNFEYRLGIYSMDFEYNTGDIINDKYLVLNRERKIFYKKDKHPVRSYTLKCLTDGYIFEIPEYMLRKQQEACPLCAGSVLVVGVNDIATLKPELIKFLVDKNDAYRYKANTKELLNFKCDICNERFQRSPSDFPISLPCGCYSAQSYPNRFILELFRQINYPFIPELRKCHFDWCGKYRYDLYFEFDNNRYIVEMDGGQHKELWRKEIDIEKDRLANQNGIEVIRIDCDYKSAKNRFSYIRDNVISSKLSSILNLDNVDWDLINVKILTINNIREVWELKKIGYTNKQISNILDIKQSQIEKYVRHGYEVGELKPFSMKDTNVYSKVMVVVNLRTNEKKYYIGLKDFYENSLEYIGIKINNEQFKNHQVEGHFVLNDYDMSKITYADYIMETAAT